ncbi:hypothetical protein GCM10022221_63470 [Actinocorallia aurea]
MADARVSLAPFLDDKDLPVVCAERFHRSVERICAAYPDVHVEAEFEVGGAAALIRKGFDRARLVVVVARGRGPVSASFLGSVSREVVRTSWVPTMVIPPAA